MPINTLYIINSSGSLIDKRVYGKSTLDTNNHLMQASYLYAMYQSSLIISMNMLHEDIKNKTKDMNTLNKNMYVNSMKNTAGMKHLNSDNIDIYIYNSPTNILFCMITDKEVNNHEEILKSIYQIYATYALKNPFYESDTPIRNNYKFDDKLNKLFKL